MLDRDKETVPLLESDVLEDERKDDTIIEMPEVAFSHGKFMENHKLLMFESTKISLLRRLEWKRFRMPYLDTPSVDPLEISECESGSSGQISVSGNDHSYVRKQCGQNPRRKIFILMKIILLIGIFGVLMSLVFGGLIERSGNLKKRQVPSKTAPMPTSPNKVDLLLSQINEVKEAMGKINEVKEAIEKINGNIMQQLKSNPIPAQVPGISNQTKAQVFIYPIATGAGWDIWHRDSVAIAGPRALGLAILTPKGVFGGLKKVAGCRRCRATALTISSSAPNYTLYAGGTEIDATGCNTITLTCTGPGAGLIFFGTNGEFLGGIFGGATYVVPLRCDSSGKWEVTVRYPTLKAINPTKAECTGSMGKDPGITIPTTTTATMATTTAMTTTTAPSSCTVPDKQIIYSDYRNASNVSYDYLTPCKNGSTTCIGMLRKQCYQETSDRACPNSLLCLNSTINVITVFDSPADKCPGAGDETLHVYPLGVTSKGDNAEAINCSCYSVINAVAFNFYVNNAATPPQYKIAKNTATPQPAAPFVFTFAFCAQAFA